MDDRFQDYYLSINSQLDIANITHTFDTMSECDWISPDVDAWNLWDIVEKVREHDKVCERTISDAIVVHPQPITLARIAPNGEIQWM